MLGTVAGTAWQLSIKPDISISGKLESSFFLAYDSSASQVRRNRLKAAMKKLSIPISERSRKYGYLYWPFRMDEEVKKFFEDASTVHLVFNGTPHGEKNIDWKYRRISIGARWTRTLPKSLATFVLTWKDTNTINITCR